MYNQQTFSLYSENVSKFGLASLLIQKNEMFDNHKYFYINLSRNLNHRGVSP